ncbi:MAG TPA: sigma-70 family RNA polymerase sigma factor [Terracidiphilus sp.]|nr:sigma-70 family RNA polymerase sigma factor [Terracidiphilus sp.]
MAMLNTPVNELARACARSADSREWEEFLRRCAPVAALVAGRITRMWTGTASPSIVDDIVQEVFLKLCEHERRILKDFTPRGEDSFFGLLRVVAASVANDYFRRQRSEKRGGKVVTLAIDEDPTTPIAAQGHSSGEMQWSVLLSELDDKLRSAQGPSAERDRTLFWLYYLQGLTAEEIAALPGSDLSAKGVESALRRVTSWLRKELEPSKPATPVQPAGEPG